MSELERALALHRAGRLAECKSIYRRLVRTQPGNHVALYWLGMLHAERGEPREAEKCLRRAARLAPREVAYHVNLGILLKNQRRPAEALECYRRALAIDPENAAACNNEGNSLLALGRAHEALACFLRALASAPDYVDAFINLGIAHQALGRLEEATQAFAEAIARAPDDADAHSNMGLVLRLRGRLDEARAELERAVSLAPGNAGAHNNLGLVWLAKGEPERAADCLRAALAIEPGFADAHANAALALERLGRLEEAVEHGRRAVSVGEGVPQFLVNLGNVLRTAGHLEESSAVLRSAVTRHPQSAEARVALGLALMRQGRLQQAEREFGKAIEVSPQSAAAHTDLGVCRAAIGDAAAAVESLRRAVALDPLYVRAHSNLLFSLNYLPGPTRAELFEEHREFARKFEQPLKARWPRHANSPELERRLRIGYVSADFREHAMSFFTEPVLALQDKSRFELFCFDAATREDRVTERFRRHADHWHRIAHLSDDAAFELVRGLQIDLLVDLSGHTADNRLELFMRRPAPVQVHWLGYPNTTGLDSIDYRITDGRADPPGVSDGCYSEKLVRLASVCAYRGPGEDCPDASPLPCLGSAPFTFASFNTLAKLTDEVLGCWSRVLRAVPDSLLVLGNLRDEATVARLRSAFARHGVAAERLRRAPRMPLQDFLRLHHGVDLALDPFPYNGGATSCHTLWMGVPFVTLEGDRYMSRIGADLLGQLGLERFVAKSEDEYVELAAGWAERRGELAEVRCTLRARLMQSALGDAAGFVRELESAYRDMWRAWCRTGPAY